MRDIVKRIFYNCARRRRPEGPRMSPRVCLEPSAASAMAAAGRARDIGAPQRKRQKLRQLLMEKIKVHRF